MGIDLGGRVAVITGGSRGIGRAIALAYAEAGAKVVVASRKQEGVEAVAGEIKARGGTALAVAAHVGQEDAVAGLVDRTLEAFGGIDILVNNAGTNPHFGPVISASLGQLATQAGTSRSGQRSHLAATCLSKSRRMAP